MHILFIDDDIKRNRPLVRYIESSEHWEVDWAESPAKALARLEKPDDIDCIVLDIMMPPDDSIDQDRSIMGMDTGLLVLEKIDEITEGKIPVVVLTARQDMQRLETDQRVKEYLKKPQPAEKVISAIKQACS